MHGTLLVIVDQPATIGALPVAVAHAEGITVAYVPGLANRIRDLLTQIHPGLQTVIGPHLDHPAMLALVAKYPTPKALRHAGKHRVETLLRKQAPRAWKRWTAAIFTALDGQTVVVSGTDTTWLVLP